MGKLFGTSGIRCKANTYPLTPDFVLRMAQVFGKSLATKYKRVSIGKDTRISGNMLESALVAGFTSVGVDVVLLGVLPTPVVANFSTKLDVDLAIVISASHNPYFDNGIKVKKGDGNSISETQEDMVEDIILSDEKIELETQNIGQVYINNEIRKQAIDFYKDFSSLKGLKVVVDSANGAFSGIADEVFTNLGAEVIAFANTPDGVNINEKCGATHVDELAKLVVKHGADIGVALDGDGDRTVVVTDKGVTVDGDQFLAFLTKYLQENSKLKGSAIVTNELSNLGLTKFCKSINVAHHMVPVGDQYIADKLEEENINFGGEGTSGHVIMRDYVISGDGLQVGVVFCQALLSYKKKMSEIFPIFDAFPMSVNNFRFESKQKVAELVDGEKMQALIKECKQELGEMSSLFVRKSGTEPVLRLYVQAENKNVVDVVTEKLKKYIEQNK